MCHYCSQGAWSQHHNNWSLQRCHPGHRGAGVISLDGLPLLSRYCYMRVRWWYDIILYTHIDVYMSLVSIVIVAQEMDLERQRNWNMKWGNWITAMLHNATLTSNFMSSVFTSKAIFWLRFRVFKSYTLTIMRIKWNNCFYKIRLFLRLSGSLLLFWVSPFFNIFVIIKVSNLPQQINPLKFFDSSYTALQTIALLVRRVTVFT